jgi:RNA polymerase sigma-70 factor (ECF subfamily)
MSAPLGWTVADPASPDADVRPAHPPRETVDTRAQSSPREVANRAMDRYADGDDGAFGEVYDFLAPRLYGFLLRQTRDAAAAEDLLQQTMLKLHVARGDFLEAADVVPWAFAIARRLFIDGYRRRKLEAAHREAEPLDETATVGAADELLEAKRAVLELDRQLALLPEAQRVVFELMKRDGLTLREVAQVLGTTTNAVKLRARRAHAALRIAMKEVADEP